MKTTNGEKIVSLQKHLEKIQNQAKNPPAKYLGTALQAYRAWVELEIKRTEAKIARLKL